MRIQRNKRHDPQENYVWLERREISTKKKGKQQFKTT